MSIYGDGLVLVPRPLSPNFPDPAGSELDAFPIEAELLDEIVAAGVAVGLLGVLTVAALADALDVLRAVTTTTVVVDGDGEQAIVAYRPLLPGEEGCGAEA